MHAHDPSTLGGQGRRVSNLNRLWATQQDHLKMKDLFKEGWRYSSVWGPWVPSLYHQKMTPHTYKTMVRHLYVTHFTGTPHRSNTPVANSEPLQPCTPVSLVAPSVIPLWVPLLDLCRDDRAGCTRVSAHPPLPHSLCTPHLGPDQWTRLSQCPVVALILS